MTSDDFEDVLKTQSPGIRLAIDPERLDAEARRFQKNFTSVLLCRDLREVSTALLLIPVWFFLGQKFSLPWTWYLIIPALVWIAGYMLVARIRNRPKLLELEKSLDGRLKNNLAQVEGQIRLLGSVLWWCLLPLAIPMLAFVVHVALLAGAMDWGTVLFISVATLFIGVIFFAVHRLNQTVVRTDLLPRREELRSQLQSF